jgi:hypothetical protein
MKMGGVVLRNHLSVWLRPYEEKTAEGWGEWGWGCGGWGCEGEGVGVGVGWVGVSQGFQILWKVRTVSEIWTSFWFSSDGLIFCDFGNFLCFSTKVLNFSISQLF